MLKQFYGSDNPSKLLADFYDAGSHTLLSLKDLVSKKGQRKNPKTWGAMDAAKLIGVSAPTFRKLQNIDTSSDGVIPSYTANGKKAKRYSLTAINRLRNLAKTRKLRPDGSSPIVLAVSNLKGGVGKTQTAVDLGKKIAIEGLSALLLDFDAQGTATLMSSGLIPDTEINYDQTITNCLISNPQLINNIIMKTNFDGFDIIPANLAIQDCDLLLPNADTNNHLKLGSPFFRLSNAIQKLKSEYDVILIDCGPNFGLLTLNALIACNGILIPIPPNMHNYSSFIIYVATLQNMFKEFPNKKLDYIRILLSKHDGSNESLQIETMMRQQFGQYMLANHMCETVEVSKAANEIGTIYDIMKPRGSRDAYRRAMNHLNDVNEEIISHFFSIWSTQAQQKKLPLEECVSHG